MTYNVVKYFKKQVRDAKKSLRKASNVLSNKMEVIKK